MGPQAHITAVESSKKLLLLLHSPSISWCAISLAIIALFVLACWSTRKALRCGFRADCDFSFRGGMLASCTPHSLEKGVKLKLAKPWDRRSERIIAARKFIFGLAHLSLVQSLAAIWLLENFLLRDPAQHLMIPEFEIIFFMWKIARRREIA